jgi:hypothetical protein
MCDWDFRAFHGTNLGNFKTLKTLELTNLCSFHIFDELRQLLRACPIENLKFSLSDFVWEIMLDHEDKFDLFAETDEIKNQGFQPGRNLKTLDICDYNLDTGDMFGLVDSSPYFFRPSLRHLDRVTLHAPTTRTLEMLGTSENLDFRFLCIQRCPLLIDALRDILKHSKRLEQLFLSFGLVSPDNQHWRKILAAICEVAPQNLKKLALLCSNDCKTIPNLPIKSCRKLGLKVPSLRRLVISAEFAADETVSLPLLEFFEYKTEKFLSASTCPLNLRHLNVYLASGRSIAN